MKKAILMALVIMGAAQSSFALQSFMPDESAATLWSGVGVSIMDMCVEANPRAAAAKAELLEITGNGLSLISRYDASVQIIQIGSSSSSCDEVAGRLEFLLSTAKPRN